MRLIWDYLKDYKKFIIINFFSVFGFVLIEIGIPTVLATGINNGFMGHRVDYILKMALVMVVFAILGFISLIILAYSTNKLASLVTMDIRNDLFTKIQSFSKDEYDKFGVSRLITNTGNDAYIIMQFLIMILRTGLMAPLMIVSSLVLIFSKSVSLGLITLISVPLMVITIILINNRTRPLSVAQQKGLDEINLQIRESLTGLRVIRGFNNEEFKEGQFEEVSLNYADISKKMFQTVAFISPVFTLVFCIVVVAVIQVGSNQIYSGVLEYGTLVAFIEYVFHALMSFLMLAAVLMMYPRAAVAVDRINEILEQEPSIGSKDKSIKEKDIKGYVEFKNVSFAYSDSAEKSVIKDVSFTVNPGETVAFIGSTGSGKSSLVKLIPRLVDVTKGEILIDGVNIKDYDIEFLRSQIGYVPQKATLFSGTIRENLQFGNRDADMDRLEYAASIAQAEEFINNTEEGFDHVLSEGGINLSGGQQQRLCIARALTRDVPIYIFDDSFSALDYKTDSVLRHRLKNELTEATMLIVAQRVSTVMDADKILVLNQGEVVGMGTHKDLLRTSDVYYEIASSQLTKEELGR